MADILSSVSFFSFVVAGLSFILTVFFGVYFRIPKIISDLSGRTARKSIAKMREINETSGKKSYHSSAVNAKRGKLTDAMLPDSDNIKKSDLNSTAQDAVITDVLEENKPSGRMADKTTVLEENITELLLTDETSGLTGKEDWTKREPGRKRLEIIDEVIYVHTDEVIE